jgi:hypothetical protein
MLHFSKLIATSFDNLKFVFNSIYTANGIKFHVSVLSAFDNRRRAIFFNMECKETKWHIVNAPKVPQWITKFEAELANEICNQLVTK